MLYSYELAAKLLLGPNVPIFGLNYMYDECKLKELNLSICKVYDVGEKEDYNNSADWEIIKDFKKSILLT